MLSPIYVAFVLLTGLLLWFIIGARGKWSVKLAMIVIVPAFMFLVWGSLSSFSGWPTTDAPPKTAYYVYGYVIEPDSNTGLKGAVYIWLIPSKRTHGVLDYAPKVGEPRAYKLPYTPGLEGQVLSANKAVSKGGQIEFKSGGKRSGGKSGYQSNHNTKGAYHFYNLRPPVLPQKGAR